MRHLVLCALTAVTAVAIFSTDAEAGRRRRWRNNCCGHVATYGQWNGNACGGCGTASYGTATYGTVSYATNYAPIQTTAACSPAQPVTYSAGYAPMNQSTVAPPPPQTFDQQPANGQQQAPPAPQPVDPENR